MNQPVIWKGPQPAAAAADIERSDLLDALARVNSFTLEDLAANRQRRLSEGQRASLEKRIRGLKIGAFLFGLVALCFLVAPLFSWGAVTAVLLVSVVPLCVVIWWFGSSRQKLLSNLQRGEVAVIEGVLTVKMRRWKNGKIYAYVIDDKSFLVPRAAYELIKDDGRRYRIYYLPGIDQMLSLEPQKAPEGGDRM